jgi:hypothetical protein
LESQNVKIINNCLTRIDFLNIKETIYSNNFSWYLNFGVNYIGDGKTQLTHTFYNNYVSNSVFFENLIPIIKTINPLALIRIKANLLLKTDKIIKHGFHTDQNYNSSTAIFYINSNNGYTEFENGQKIYSEENKLVIFDNFIKHTGTTCTDQNERIVLNFNFIEKKNDKS